MQSKKATSEKANKTTKSLGSTQRHRKSSVAASSEGTSVPQAAVRQPTTEASVETPLAPAPKPMLIEQPVHIGAKDISREEIARLAYSLWQARGHHQGTSEQDWLRAESELTLMN